ncbi:ATP-binding cassette sub-family C member 2 [Halotydeus destructor]|nr:ATP-binding cassette sub-family C member 2 [Halotydeus destructor]
MNDLGKYVHTSVALFAFWSFMALGSLVTATSVGYSLYEEKSLKWILEKETFQRIITDFPFSLAMFFLVQIQDLPNELYYGQIVSFYDRASVVSKFTFYWMVPVIATMKQKVPITSTHYLIDVLDIDKCEELHERLGEHWETRKPGAILWPLFKTFRSSIIKIFVCKLVQVVATLSLPVFGDLLLTWLSDPDRYVWHAYFYVMMIFVGRIVLVLNIFRASNITQRFSLEMRTLLTSMIHRKILKMSPLVKAKYTSGQLSNLAFTDPQRIVNVFQYLPELFNIPLTIGFCLYLLWAQLGSATITALISLLSLIPYYLLCQEKIPGSAKKFNESQRWPSKVDQRNTEQHQGNQTLCLGEAIDGERGEETKRGDGDDTEANILPMYH